jgi:DNA replication and repair protein RecF
MLRELELTNFRSYATARVKLHPEVTLVVGPNASGKTNLLEALYVLATTKSFRAADADLVRRGEEYYRVVVRGKAEYALGLAYTAGGWQKQLTRDGAKVPLAAHVGDLQVVLFEPAHLEMVSGPPEGRRRYVDFILCQTDRRYLKTLRSYKRVLRQRNALLGGAGGGAAVAGSQLFAWNVKLAELAVEIVARRTELLVALGASLPGLYAGVAGAAPELTLEYLPSVSGDYGDGFLEALERNLARDLAAGFTTIGPHREDWRVRFGGAAVGAVASRGEVRTLVLALKLAEMDYLESRTGRRPLLLLDDVFSELDSSRRASLINRLQGRQSVITTTDADAVVRAITSPLAVVRPEELVAAAGAPS